jgi:acetyl esterase/lipase
MANYSTEGTLNFKYSVFLPTNKTYSSMKFHISFFLGLLVFSYSPAYSQSQQGEKSYLSLPNIAYGTAPDQRNLVDIYLPKNHSQKTKMVVFIHGGFWTKGSKSQLPQPLIELLVGQKSYAMASINYRYVKKDGNKYPTQQEDVSKALQYLSKKADSLGYKKNSFALIGASAGAHLALMQGFSQDPKHWIKTIVDIVGPTDLADPVVRGRQGIADATISYFLGNPNADAVIAKEASPIQYITKKNKIPTIIFHGENDELVDVHQAKNLHQKLLENGIKTEIVLYPNETHEMKKSLPDVFLKTAGWLEKVY